MIPIARKTTSNECDKNVALVSFALFVRRSMDGYYGHQVPGQAKVLRAPSLKRGKPEERITDRVSVRADSERRRGGDICRPVAEPCGPGVSFRETWRGIERIVNFNSFCFANDSAESRLAARDESSSSEERPLRLSIVYFSTS